MIEMNLATLVETDVMVLFTVRSPSIGFYALCVMGLFGVRAETAPRYAPGDTERGLDPAQWGYSARGLLDPYNIVRKFG